MRALVMDYSDDEKTYDIDDQFMFGPAFMACPVYEYKAATVRCTSRPAFGTISTTASVYKAERQWTWMLLTSVCLCS